MVIRGMLIKHGARIKRKRSEQLKLLLEDLAILELHHKWAQTPSLERDLLAKRTQVLDLLQYKAKAALQVCRKFSYESGDKCGKVLARTLREQKLKTYIPQLTSPNRPKVTKPYDIVQEFQEFYKSLYNLQTKSPTQAQIDLNLSSSLMPRLLDADRENLEEPITIKEPLGSSRGY